jgi:ABC-2 type transport system permease protein
MMRVLDLAYKDIRQILRDWKSALFLLVMPVLFTVFFGLIFGPVLTSSQQKDPRLPVGWINQDSGGLLSGSLESLLNQSDVIRPVILEGDKAVQASGLVDKGDLAAVVRMPAGYSQAIIADQPASLELNADQSIPSGRTVVTALDTVTGRLLGAAESAHISVETYQNQVGTINDTARQAYFQQAFTEAIFAWKVPPLTVKIEQATGKATSSDPSIKINGFTQSSAGMIVQFAIFGLINSAMLLVLERKTRCLQRLLTTPIRRAEVIGGHILAMFLVVFAQEMILVILGQFVFGVNYFRQPGAILVMMVALALWAASFGLLIGAIAKGEDQVIVLCLIAMFLFSAMGGAWFPLDVAGKAFSAIGHVLPTAWAMDGFQNIVLRGLAFNSVLLPAGLLLAYALAFFGLALWRFKFE